MSGSYTLTDILLSMMLMLLLFKERKLHGVGLGKDLKQKSYLFH